MKTDNDFFIEIDHASLCQKGQGVPGDICFVKHNNKRTALTLSDGLGSGIKANITANVIGSMAATYILGDVPAGHAAETILRTFADEGTGELPASFTIADIGSDGTVHIAELGNPDYLLTSGTTLLKPKKELVKLGSGELKLSSFRPQLGERLILFSDGITASGSHTRRLPAGWKRQGVKELCVAAVKEKADISAAELCRKILGQAEANDLFTPRNDMTCAVIYFRKPRRMIVSSGPPFNENKDPILADMVATYEGEKIICGGTTAKIISRELGREMDVELNRDPSGLPPTYRMEGLDLVTEGVLTLNKVKNVLLRATGTDIDRTGTDGKLAGMLLDHDIIDFIVGTRINPLHQDPDLPMELELRRNIIKAIAHILEHKFLKDVRQRFI